MLQPALSGLLPHPPIVVPLVGGGRGEEGCRATTEACRELARRLVEAAPRRLCLVSPHSPRGGGAFGIWQGERLAGDLGAFRAPEAAVDLPNDAELSRALVAEAGRSGLACWSIPAESMDHGAVVPLWFLQQAGWCGPTSVLSLPLPDRADPGAVGSALGRVVEELGEPAALIASGDMTHRGSPGAPSGYHPRALEFDRELRRLVGQGRLEDIPRIDPQLRSLAAEDAADSATLVAAAHGFRAHAAEELSYECPFGVGYLVAVFHDGG